MDKYTAHLCKITTQSRLIASWATPAEETVPRPDLDSRKKIKIKHCDITFKQVYLSRTWVKTFAKWTSRQLMCVK
jgi:hypothetical protein